MSATVLICGGRNYDDNAKVCAVLNSIRYRLGISTLIEGGATGADRLAYNWAIVEGINMRRFEADWKKHGLAAGPIRNQQMIDEGKPTIVVAFPGGNGTADMVRRARKAGIFVIEGSK